jgi:hypothetical protein
VVDVVFAGRCVAWAVDAWDDVPSPLNLLNPSLPTKRELLQRLRQTNPDLTVLWLPRFLLAPLSWAASVLQKLLRPHKPSVDIAKVFSVLPYDTSVIARLSQRIDSPSAS